MRMSPPNRLKCALFIDYKYDNAGLLCTEELVRTLNVDISTTRDISQKVVPAFFSLNA